MDNILLLNFITYVVWGGITYYNHRKISAYLFMIIFYAFLAGMGYYTVEYGIYQDTFGTVNVKNLSPIPYIYCFITYVILIFPLKRLNKIDTSGDDWIFSNRVKLVIKMWMLVAIAITLLKFVQATISISTGLGAAYESRHIDGEILFTYDNVILNQLNGKGPFFMEATIPIIIYYAIVGLKKRFVGPLKAYSLFFLSFAWSFLGSLASGSRGGIFITVFCFCFFVFVFFDYFSKKQIKVISMMGFALICIFVFYSWIITVERVGDFDGFNSILRYFGESFPNLGFNFWDKVTYHPMGERLFPIENDSRFDSIDEFYRYWGIRTGVPVLNFKTYFGDLYIEFGIVGSFIFTISSSLLANTFIFKKKVSIISLPLIYFYFQLCVFSFSGFTKGGHHALFQVYVILFIMLCLVFLKKKNNFYKYG